MPGNIYLVGLMGCGKTTVGKQLAALLQWSFVDTDRILEEKTGVSVGHIFELEGEQGFRQRESRLLRAIAPKTDHVVSTGGGIILDPKNRECMHNSGVTVYLNAPLDVLWPRLRDCRARPLLQTENPQEKLQAMMRDRHPMYRDQADLVVAVGTDSVATTVASIADWFGSDNRDCR